MQQSRKNDSVSRSIDKKLSAKPLARKSSNKILIEPILHGQRPSITTCHNPKKYLLKVYSGTASLNTSQVQPKQRKRMGRKLLKLAPIMKAILKFLKVTEIVQKVVQLGKLSRT